MVDAFDCGCSALFVAATSSKQCLPMKRTLAASGSRPLEGALGHQLYGTEFMRRRRFAIDKCALSLVAAL